MDETRECYDCHHQTTDWVLEARSIGGDHFGHVDYRQMTVHANRRECREARAADAMAEKRAGMEREAAELDWRIPELLQRRAELYRQLGKEPPPLPGAAERGA